MWLSKIMKKTANGFATKGDLKNLEKKMDLGFAGVDKRFEQVDEKLVSIGIRLGVFKLDWDLWKQDTFTEFNSRWVNKIDPILAEIEKHREKEVIWGEQSKRMEKKMDKFGEGLIELRGRMDKFGEKLETVAKKVGA